MEKNKLLRMDNVGIVVESLDNAISFFTEIGLTSKKSTKTIPRCLPCVKEIVHASRLVILLRQ